MEEVLNLYLVHISDHAKIIANILEYIGGIKTSVAWNMLEGLKKVAALLD